MLANRRGFTLYELIAAVGVMALLVAGTTSVYLAGVLGYDRDTAQIHTDNNAITALQYIVLDVREAVTVSTPNGGTQLVITFPSTKTGTFNGQTVTYYDRTSAPDTVNQVTYYTSDSTGIMGNGHTGSYLWRKQVTPNNGTRLICFGSNFDTPQFLQDADAQSAVDITITARDSIYKVKSTDSGFKRTDLTQRVVYMRNYYHQ